MHLRYINKLGISKDIELTTEPLSIGRSREADISLLDDKVSRVHAGIRLSNGAFYLKDLKSRNGTFVNGERVEDTVEVKAGDRIQIGSTVFVMENASKEEAEAQAFNSVEDAMDDGKGYSTILKEIVEDITPSATEAAAEEAAPSASASTPASIKISRPAIRISSAPQTPQDPPDGTSPAGKKKIIIKR
ncbi:MAG: FHA domain-containing protein [Verrucomicrobiota bacterium]|jgi:predicted component of type VI protein secretion system|nr:FHA domain-containing protein [Verrucomicrobiota bacterium]